MKSPIVGIDLGTTFSLVAYLAEGRPTLIPNSLGEVLTPSAVALGPDGDLLVGAAARAFAVLRPRHTALAFKRDMGTPQQYMLGETAFSPVQLSSLVLGALKHDAEAALGVPIVEAVVTVPAYFNDLQRQATRDAAAMAGLQVDRIINEPTAAALAYGLDHRGARVRAAVLDLGGGTFDVTVLEVVERVVEIHSSAGDARLGGEDFVSALVDLVAERLRDLAGMDPRGTPQGHAHLRTGCERVMHRLSEDESAEIALPNTQDAGTGSVVRMVVSRVEAEQAWQPLLQRLEPPVRRALHDARMDTGQLEEVLLVGGASRIPCVARLFEKLTRRPGLRTLNPDQAVALGAAIQGSLKAQDTVVDLVVTDIAPFTLGIRTRARFGRRNVDDLFSPILERGTVVPASRVERFTTVAQDQRQIRVAVFQGEHSVCALNTPLGEYVFEAIPPGVPGAEAIDVRFTYDLNGLLDVDVTLVSTGRTESFYVVGRPHALTPAQIEEARTALSRFKIHPREALPNATAIARAEAAFVDLTGDERAALGQALAAFRAALDGQDPRKIDEARRVLVALTRQLRDR